MFGKITLAAAVTMWIVGAELGRQEDQAKDEEGLNSKGNGRMDGEDG